VIKLEPGFVGTERMAQDLKSSGFDASSGLSVDVPSFAVEAQLVDGTRLPGAYGPAGRGLPRR
jgi:hypothetical protein